MQRLSILQQPALLTSQALLTSHTMMQTTERKQNTSIMKDFNDWTVAKGRPLLDNGEGKLRTDSMRTILRMLAK
jgi:hypothetical protein